MSKKSKAKSENEGAVNNIDAATVKTLFEQEIPAGVILTSSIPQMKDLGPDGYRYTMWGLDGDKRCLIIMAADRNGVVSKDNWAAKYPAMKTVSGPIVIAENQKYATHKIVSLCGKNTQIVAKTAQAIFIREDEKMITENGKEKNIKVPVYGYAMMAKQNQQDGFVILENGASNLLFTSEKPKFL